MTATGPRGVGGRIDTILWEKFYRDPTFWWDNRFNKRNKYFPDFKHVSTGESLWIADRKTPTWVSAKLESLADPAVGKATTARYKFPHDPPVAGDNPVSLGRLIKDSAESRCLSLGRQAHEAVLKSDEHKSNIYLLTGLIDMYCKCGVLEEARKIFDSMGTRDSVSYNAIINGCNSNGQPELALEYYSALRADTTIQPNACTYTCVLVACGSVMATRLGREIHQLAKHNGLLKNNPVLASSLVSFYGKCGDVDSAQEAFNECRAEGHTGLWNSLIQAYTLQGRSIEALERFYSMTQEEGCKANDVTFVTVLNACSHGGLVEKGRHLLDEMPKRYGVKPGPEHYGCLIDMLGRANQLDEAMRVMRTMPFEPDAVAWASLLGACRKWKNYSIGKLAFQRFVEMDPKSGTPYVFMASIFENLGMLSESESVVERMRGERSIRKAGRSWWTDSSGKVHSRTVGNRNHSQIESKLKQLLLRMRGDHILQDIPEEAREDHMCVVKNLASL